MTKEISKIIGDLIHEAFFNDGEMREKIRPINHFISQAARSKVKSDPKLAMPLFDMFNSYFVSSYHAARSIELIIDTARNAYRSKDHNATTLLITVQHAFGLESIVKLNSSKLFLTNAQVVEALGLKDSTSIDAAYDNRFPRLREARDSFVHDDERALGFARGKPIGEGLESLQQIEQYGNRLRLKDADGKDLVFEFKPSTYLALLDDLARILVSS